MPNDELKKVEMLFITEEYQQSLSQFCYKDRFFQLFSFNGLVLNMIMFNIQIFFAFRCRKTFSNMHNKLLNIKIEYSFQD